MLLGLSFIGFWSGDTVRGAVGKVIAISYPTSLLSITSFRGLALEEMCRRGEVPAHCNPCVSSGAV